MEKLRVGVIGVGIMGVNHVRNYADEPGRFELVGVYDSDKSRAEAIAGQFHTKAFDSLGELLDAVDAVSVVVPSSLHKDIGLKVARHGVHALIEKPLALNSADAETLTRAFRKNGLVLQVGHIERFNPVVMEMKKLIDPNKVVYIETHRYGPFSGNGRITDASVVEDLMIHDIDLVCDFMSPLKVESICAEGENLHSNQLDFATALFRFGSRAHATISVSRVSQDKERTITVHMENNCIHADLLMKTLTITQHTDVPEIKTDFGTFRQDSITQRIFVPIKEPLRQELMSFYDVVVNHANCPVTGEMGTIAVQLCEIIASSI